MFTSVDGRRQHHRVNIHLVPCTRCLSPSSLRYSSLPSSRTSSCRSHSLPSSLLHRERESPDGEDGLALAPPASLLPHLLPWSLVSARVAIVLLIKCVERLLLHACSPPVLPANLVCTAALVSRACLPLPLLFSFSPSLPSFCPASSFFSGDPAASRVCVCVLFVCLLLKVCVCCFGIKSDLKSESRLSSHESREAEGRDDRPGVQRHDTLLNKLQHHLSLPRSSSSRVVSCLVCSCFASCLTISRRFLCPVSGSRRG